MCTELMSAQKEERELTLFFLTLITGLFPLFPFNSWPKPTYFPYVTGQTVRNSRNNTAERIITVVHTFFPTPPETRG